MLLFFFFFVGVVDVCLREYLTHTHTHTHTKQGLEHLHAHQMIHCDLKPSNLFVGGDGQVVIGDFDVSKDLSTRQQDTVTLGTTRVHGTRGYFAPEVVLKGQLPSSKSDMYAFGLILMEVFFPEVKRTQEYPSPTTVRLFNNNNNKKKRGYESMKEVIEQLLEHDVDKRLSASDTVCHKAFIGGVMDTTKEIHVDTPPYWYLSGNMRGGGGGGGGGGWRGDVEMLKRKVDVTHELKDNIQKTLDNVTFPSFLGIGRDASASGHSRLEVCILVCVYVCMCMMC